MKKFLLVSILALASYAGIYSWAILRVPEFSSECTANPIDREMLENPKKHSTEELIKFRSRFWGCVRQKQTWIERIIVTVPKW